MLETYYKPHLCESKCDFPEVSEKRFVSEAYKYVILEAVTHALQTVLPSSSFRQSGVAVV